MATVMTIIGAMGEDISPRPERASFSMSLAVAVVGVTAVKCIALSRPQMMKVQPSPAALISEDPISP